MNVDESPTTDEDWGEGSLEQVRRELDDALSVKMIPIKFHHGIHRILEFINGYQGSVYVDDTQDLTMVMADQVVNTQSLETGAETYIDREEYDLNGTMGCLALGSEFGIFSVSRGSAGGIHVIDTRKNAIPFLMSIVGDYDLGLHVAMMLARRSEASAGSNSANQASLALFGHWRDMGRMMLAATISPDGQPVPYERALQAFGELLSGSENESLILNFGKSGGFEDALDKLTALKLLKRTNGKIQVRRSSAVLFLTSVDDKPLLEKLAASRDVPNPEEVDT
jgi:hypothetical protein